MIKLETHHYFSILFIALSAMAFLRSINAACLDQAGFYLCRNRTQDSINACATNDYSCYCEYYSAYANCYNRCTDDPTLQSQAPAAQSKADQQCSLAPPTPTPTYTPTSSSNAAPTIAPTQQTGSTTPKNNNANALQFSHFEKVLLSIPAVAALLMF